MRGNLGIEFVAKGAKRNLHSGNFGGVAPQIIYTAKNRKVHCIDGLGVWPRAVTPDYFTKKHGGKIPPGIERCVVPAAPDAWLTALGQYGGAPGRHDIAAYPEANTLAFRRLAAGGDAFGVFRRH